jgi:hypothetical protein
VQQPSNGPDSAAVRRKLHGDVQSFIDRTSHGLAPVEPFERLALSILGYQAEHVPAYARLCAEAGVHPRDARDPRMLPAMPTEAFRLARIAAHSASEDAVVFRTSGTTAGARGEHPLSTTSTYERGALAWGKWGLFFDEKPRSAIVLGPRHENLRDSSLFFMIQLFADRFASSATFLQTAADQPIPVDTLIDACTAAALCGEPAILLGTSFAFVHALDAIDVLQALEARDLRLPPGSVAMHTGGFKGRSREVAPAELRASIGRTFGLDPNAVVGEYGMTELSSQLYEGTLRARAGLPTPVGRHGVFVAPPWLRVVAVEPETWLPLPDREIGILRFEDLANIDSALAVQTADRGRIVGRTVELFGRLQGATPRGCSFLAPEPREP